MGGTNEHDVGTASPMYMKPYSGMTNKATRDVKHQARVSCLRLLTLRLTIVLDTSVYTVAYCFVHRILVSKIWSVVLSKQLPETLVSVSIFVEIAFSKERGYSVVRIFSNLLVDSRKTTMCVCQAD